MKTWDWKIKMPRLYKRAELKRERRTIPTEAEVIWILRALARKRGGR